MTQIKIDIEESKAMLEKGKDIIVLKRGTKRFYAHVKLTGSKDTPWELIPLTTSELKELGVSVEESAQGETENNWNVDVEESEGQPEQPKGKVYKINPNDPASIAAAKEALSRVENAQNAEQLAEENLDLKNKLGLLAEKEIEKKIQNLGVKDPELIKELHDPEKLTAFEKGFNKEGIGSPSGSAPLNEKQLGIQNPENEDILKKQWNSPEEMIMYLRKNKSAQNEAILRKLWEKAIEASKIHHTPMQYPPEDEKKEGKVPDRNFLNPDSIHEEQSEFERLGVQKKNPLWYAQKNKEEFEKIKKEIQKQRESKS